jgi:hypothetical protein
MAAERRPLHRLSLACPPAEKAHRREREARARSDEFRRYTWLDVVEEPIPTVVDLKQLLGA